MCFWPAKTRRNLEIFEMHTCHWHGAQIRFRHEWRKLFTSSLLFHCIDRHNCFQYWNEFFVSCVSGFRLKFFRIALRRKRLQLDSKSDLTTNWLILGFLLANGFFRWLHICIDWNLQQLLVCHTFLTTSIFSDVLFEGYSGLFFKKACTFFAVRCCNNDW